MTDDIDTMRDALRTARPSSTARKRGIEGAMAAFDSEFSANDEKNTVPLQGSDAERRLTSRKARSGRAEPRRSKMSRLSTLTMAVGGTGIAAVLALFIVVQNDDLSGIRVGDWTMSSLHEDAAIGERLENVPKTFRQKADAEADIAGGEISAIAATPAPQFAAGIDAASPPAPFAVTAPDLRQQRSLVQDSFAGIGGNAVTATAKSEARRIAIPAPQDTLSRTYRDDGRDRFTSFEPNSVKSSRDEPVSTFSIDVDTASYSYLRRGLNGGRIPPARAIRVEELVNYFPYGYPGSDNADEPFKASVSVVPTPWNAGTQLMHIGIKGYVPPAAERPRANIVLLIDTSGSMNAPDKLPLLINSFRLLLATLDEDDTISIVTYAGSAGTVLEPTAASERSKIEDAFDRLRAGGSTAGAAGLRLAYDKAQESFDAEAVNRVILATDGDFNVGFSSPEEMKAYVEKKRETGVFLSVLGFGQGNYNDALMQALAQNGNGVAAYIDTLSEARKVLAGEAGGALVPIAKDVKIQVEFNPATISEYRLIGYETRALNREDFNNDKVDAGDINSGHTVTAIYEITPTGSPAETIDPLRYGADALTVSENASDELAFVKIRHKLPNSDTSTLQTRPVTQGDVVGRLDIADREARFAIAVAAIGQKLQGQSALSDYDWDDAIALANGARGDDPFGYRAEFVGLARLAKSLDTRR